MYLYFSLFDTHAIFDGRRLQLRCDAARDMSLRFQSLKDFFAEFRRHSASELAVIERTQDWDALDDHYRSWISGGLRQAS